MGDKSVLMQCGVTCAIFVKVLNDSEALPLPNPKRRVIVKFGASVPSNPILSMVYMRFWEKNVQSSNSALV